MSNVKHVKFLSRFKKVKNKKDNYNIIQEYKELGCTVYTNFTRRKALDFMENIMKKSIAQNGSVAICGRGEELDLDINNFVCFKLRLAQA